MVPSMTTIVPTTDASRIEIELHIDAKDGDHNAWLARVYGEGGTYVSAGTGDTAPAALLAALKPYECLLAHPT